MNSISKIALVSILVALVSSGAVYAAMSRKATSDKSELNSQISSLQETVKTLSASQNTTTTLTNDQIFQEVSDQLGIARSSLTYFRIYGQDRVQYSITGGNTYAFKSGGKWTIAANEPQSLIACSAITNVPVQYMPPCANGNSHFYIAADGTSVNYPPSAMTSYIGQ